MNLHNIKRSDTCLNCGTALDAESDNYCPSCGQLNDVRKETVGHLLRDLIEEFLHLDSKVMRSIVPLIFKPGRIAKEYIEGRRVRYFHPVRMFLTLTVVMFIAFGLENDHSSNAAGHKSTTLKASATFGEDSLGQGKPDTVTIGTARFSRDSLRKVMMVDGITDQRQLMERFGIESTILNSMLLGFVLKTIDNDGLNLDEYLLSKAHWVLFSLMPVFAIALLVFFGRNTFTMVDHLVHAFYLHSGTFLIMSISRVLSYLVFEEIDILLAFIVPAYFLISLHTVYQKSWTVTVLKGLGVGAIYLTLGIMVISAVTFVLLFIW